MPTGHKFLTPARGKIVRLSFWISLPIITFSCTGNSPEHSAGIPINDDPVLKRDFDSVVYKMKDEYMSQSNNGEWIIKAGSPDTIPFSGIRTIEAGVHSITMLDQTNPRVVTPGKDSVPFPRVYTLPEPARTIWGKQWPGESYTVQHGDTIYSPVMVRALQTEAIRARPMRMKDSPAINIQYLDQQQGLKDPDISCLMQDSRGNMWFGSQSGVCRYDGNTFTYFTVNEGLTNDFVVSLLEDRAGNIWIGTTWGLCKYDGKWFTHYFVGQRENYCILSMLEAGNGDLWIGTIGGLLRYSGDNWTLYADEQGMSRPGIKSIIEDKQGNIWAATDQGICKYDGSSFTWYTQQEGLNSIFVSSLIEDRKGKLWIGTTEGVCKYDGESITWIGLNDGNPEHQCTSLLEDADGHIWLGTVGGGIYQFNGDSFSLYTTREGLSSNTIFSMVEDRGGRLWLRTPGAGVMKFQKKSFAYFPHFEEISKGNVQSIKEDARGNILMASGGGGLLICDGEGFTNLTVKHGLPIDYLFSVHPGADDLYWIGSPHGGFVKYDGSKLSFISDACLYHGSGSKFICDDISGNIWLGTWRDGLKKYNEGLLTCYRGLSEDPNELGNQLFPKLIVHICVDSRENIWYCADDRHGVFKYDGEYITHFIIAEDSVVQNVTSIFEDECGHMWFGTKDIGIMRYDGHQSQWFTEKEGLSDNSTRSVIGDHDGNIWVGTRNGLSKLTPEKDGSYSIAAYGFDDGLVDLSFNQNAVCLDSRNRLWWGTGEIVTMLDLNNFAAIPEHPVIQLNNVLVNQEFIDFGARELEKLRGLKYQNVAPFYNYPINPELSHDLNHLTFHFSATEWTAPQKIGYQYLLEGLDDQWGTPQTVNSVDYRNIPPGKYLFKVRAISKSNVLSETLEYPFTIKPPWWRTWWTIVFYSLMLLLFLRYCIKYFVGRERIKAEVHVRKMELEKMQEMDQIKSRFFANISHEFRTPLTLLLEPINDLIRKPDMTSDAAQKLLQVMKRNATRLQQLINQLLDLSRLEIGKLKLEVSEGDLTVFIRSIVLSFLSLAESKKIRYTHELEGPSSQVFYDGDKIEKIVSNLISNALKFTPREGAVSVALSYKEERPDSGILAQLVIKDSGPGIPDEHKEKIFDRFDQAGSSDARNHEGSGIGLALVKELVELIGGEIHVESKPGSGSTFIVKLPVSREQFSEAEIVMPVRKGSDPEIPDVHDDSTLEAFDTKVKSDQQDRDMREKPVILVVEDNPDLRDYISQNLLDAYQILQAENGNDGLQKAIESIPDLVISDLMMPEMDGMEMCLKIRADHRTDHIPLIMLTAKADRDSKMESLETGADDYILKPFDAEELKVRVKNLIDQRRKLRERYRKEFLSDTGNMEIPPPEDEFMARVMNCIKKHLSESEFNVEQMGRELGLSRTQLYRKILALTDHTPSELIRSKRLKMAARMFSEGYKNVTQVMYAVGFDTSVNFAQHFRQMFRVNPSEYVKRITRSKR